MKKHLLKDALGWGFLLWLIGYLLGMALFFAVPASAIGWIITPLGVAITLWVLIKKAKENSFTSYLILACAWTAIALALDYLLIVKPLKPADGYYKLDVYLYYALIFLLPVAVGWSKTRRRK